MGVIRRDEPEKPHKDDPPCTCGCKAIIDVNRHDWRCARRLWIERNDARGAVEAERARIVALIRREASETFDMALDHELRTLADRIDTGGQ